MGGGGVCNLNTPTPPHTLQVVNASSALVPSCQFGLLAKDGVFLPLMPRRVDHIFLSAAARAEVLVRCDVPGKYVLTAGRRPSPFGPGFGSSSWLQQDVVLTLDVKPGKGKVRGSIRGCCMQLVPRWALLPACSASCCPASSPPDRPATHVLLVVVD